MKAKKQIIYKKLAIVVFIFGLISCHSPILTKSNKLTESNYGQVSIVFTKNQNSRTILPQVERDIAKYSLHFSSIGEDDKIFNVLVNEELSFTLKTGQWELNLLAKNLSDKNIYGAKANFTVTSGGNTSVPISLAYLEGSGNLSILFEWDKVAPVGTNLEIKINDNDAETFNIDNKTKHTYTKNNLDSGFYSIKAVAKNTDETTFNYGAADSFLILKDETTSGIIGLGGYEIIPDPQLPEEHPFPDFLGAIYETTQTTFRIWSPDYTNVKVKLNGTNHTLTKRNDFNEYTDVYEVIVPGDWKNKEYEFYVNNKTVRDPYGVMVIPNTNTNIVIDLASIEPEGGWVSPPVLTNRTDAIIYEVHVRDFTQHTSWNGTESKRGKFLGMVEPGTTLDGYKTGLDHLKELGVTHIQILPFYDFATDHYNWGYDPKNWNIPEEQYSSVYDANPTDYEGRIRELMTMINEFHKHGFRVIMDVVYNHTFGDEQFENITSQYYTGNNDSGTGNGINSAIPMVSRTIRDSQEFWAGYYKVDGFRHDLLGVFHVDAVKNWGQRLNVDAFPSRNLLIYGEPWNGYFGDPNEGQKIRYGRVHELASVNIGVFNGGYREALKGQSDDPGNAYIFNDFNHGKVDGGWAIYDGMRGSPYEASGQHSNSTWGRNYAANPAQAINYISAHDNFCFWDRVYIGLATNVVQAQSKQVQSFTPPTNLGYAKRIVDFGTGILLTSQGIPFIHAGDEILRTKTKDANISSPSAWSHGQYGGTHNTYNSPDSFNMIRWSWKADNQATFNYIKSLIEIRKEHPSLRLSTNELISDNLVVSRPDEFGGKVITGHLTYSEDSHNLFIVYNSGDNVNIALPSGNWSLLADASGYVNESGKSGSVVCEGTAVTIFAQQR